MNTAAWGPSMWVALHTISFGYPEKPTLEHKQKYKVFFTNIKDILPCVYCRDSYTQFIKIINIDDYLETRDCLTYWLYLIHDLVNKKLNKQSPTFEEVQRKYESMRVGNNCKRA